jgi:hypothetical protein
MTLENQSSTPKSDTHTYLSLLESMHGRKGTSPFTTVAMLNFFYIFVAR